MKQNIKVRVDFLEDGQIVPLMFVNGKSSIIRIDRIIESSRVEKNTFKFVCRINEEVITILLEDYIWYLLNE